MSTVWYILFFSVLILIFISIIIGAYSQRKLNKIFSKYYNIKTKCEINSFDLATILKSKADIPVDIIKVDSKSTNHYSSKYKILKLSTKFADSIAISALSYVARELGNAIQDSKKYFSYKIKKILQPVVRVLNASFIPLALLGFFFKFNLGLPIAGLIILIISIALLIFSFVFYLVTYKTEDKSAKIIADLLNSCEFLTEDELFGLKDVLYDLKWLYFSEISQSVLFFLDFFSFTNVKKKIMQDI